MNPSIKKERIKSKRKGGGYVGRKFFKTDKKIRGAEHNKKDGYGLKTTKR